MIITSKDNDQLKHIRKLKEKKYRDEYKEYIIEGIKIVKEAIKEKVDIKEIIICENYLKNEEFESQTIKEFSQYKNIYVDEKIFKSITDVKNPQGILAIVSQKEETKIKFNEDIILILDDIQDPGNLGTILRTIDSIGLKQVIISKNTGDVYSPKVVRSTMGAIFRINVIRSENIEKTINNIKENNFEIIVTSLKGKKSIYEIDYNKKAIVIGNEAKGVSSKILEMSDKQVIIPMLGKTESLNAAVATGIITYEYVRQKIAKNKE